MTINKVENDSLEMPLMCKECPKNRQGFFWRTFTETSLREFVRNKGFGKNLNLGEDNLITDPLDESRKGYRKTCKELEEPGFLWISRDPALSLGVGLARGIIAREKMYLLGINACPCDISLGFRAFTTYRTKTNNYLLEEIDSISLPFPDPMSDFGEITDYILPTQIKSGVAYDVDPTFFLRSVAPIVNSRINESSIKAASVLLVDSLRNMSSDDPDRSWKIFNNLPESWGIFLSRIPNSTFSS